MRLIGIFLLIFLVGCGPDKANIQTEVTQAFNATNLSILSQVNWEKVMTHIRGKVGPDFAIVVEGYVKQTAGFEMRIRGGEVEIDTQASGSGGNDNSIMASWPEIVQAAERWQRASDNGTRDQIAKELADAIISRVKKESPPAATQPGS